MFFPSSTSFRRIVVTISLYARRNVPACPFPPCLYSLFVTQGIYVSYTNAPQVSDFGVHNTRWAFDGESSPSCLHSFPSFQCIAILRYVDVIIISNKDKETIDQRILHALNDSANRTRVNCKMQYSVRNQYIPRISYSLYSSGYLTFWARGIL